MTCQLFAGISVSDYPVALDWYERLLGQPPSFSPNDVEWVWDINESGWVYVEHRHQHAGRRLHLHRLERGVHGQRGLRRHDERGQERHRHFQP